MRVGVSVCDEASEGRHARAKGQETEQKDTLDFLSVREHNERRPTADCRSKWCQNLLRRISKNSKNSRFIFTDIWLFVAVYEILACGITPEAKNITTRDKS